MKLPQALRLALIPLGVLIAHRGLQYLTDEHDRLTEEIGAYRAELAGERVDPADENPDSSISKPAPVSATRRRIGMVLAVGLGALAAGTLAAAAAERVAAAFTGQHPDLPIWAPCGICERPTTALEAFPGHICIDCWPDQMVPADPPAQHDTCALGCTDQTCTLPRASTEPPLLIDNAPAPE